MLLTFLKTDGCKIVKQKGRVSLVVTKERECYSIWVDGFIVSDCGAKDSMRWFNEWIKKVESGEYDESEHGKRRAQLARQQDTAVGQRPDTDRIDFQLFALAVGTQTVAAALWLCVV